MPWRIEHAEGGSFVVSESTGKRMNQKPLSEDEAKRYLRALYANDTDSVSKEHSSVIVSLPIPEPIASALCGMAEMHIPEGTVPASEMHITLMYLGKKEELPLDYEDRTRLALGSFVIEWYDKFGGMPLGAEVQGTGRFNSCSEEGMSALYYVVSGHMLDMFRSGLVESLERDGIYGMSEHGFVPHITMAYVPQDAPTPTIVFPSLPIAFTSVALWCGPNQYNFLLAESPVEVSDADPGYVHMSTDSSPDAAVIDFPAELTVFKTASGQSRWVLYSSNGYEDREKECIETKALEEDCVRADEEAKLVGLKAYGPLRWWHHGEVVFERPGDWTSAYAGPGADLGMCDFNAVVNGILVESGTFFDERYADVLAAVSKEMRASISFAKPRGDPGPEKVYTKIRRYERSLVPLRYALPSNRFTAFAVRKG